MPKNMVADAEIRTGLAEQPNTPAYRQQTQTQLKEIITALGNNPQALALLAPAYIESTSHPNRQELADDMRRSTGQPIPGDRQGRQKAEQAQQAAAQRQNQLAEEKLMAEVEDKRAGAALKKAQATKVELEVDQMGAGLDAGGPVLDAQAKQLANQRTQQEMAANDPAVDAALQEAMGGL